MRSAIALALLVLLAQAPPADAQDRAQEGSQDGAQTDMDQGGGPAQQPPLQQQWQEQGAAPTPSLNAPAPSESQDQQDAGDGAAPAQTGQGPATFARPNNWTPARTARIQALDKINAQASDLTIPVGQSKSFGSLTITVRACVVRPSDQPPDAAAFLDVTDSHPESSGFSGWMLEKEPALSMMQSPIYDLRVTGCA